jgi:hypothetical protein
VERAADLPEEQAEPVVVEEESVSVRAEAEAEAASRDCRAEASGSASAGAGSIRTTLSAESGAQTKRRGRSG